MRASFLIPVIGKSQVGEARRQARVWTQDAGGDEELVSRVALVVTELANNLLLHTAKGGALLLRRLEHDNVVGIEILALDDGPGAANFGAFMRDGFSTTGTPGTGLGAVQRASHVFEVHSQPGIGTALLSEVWAKYPPARASRWRVGAVNLPMRNETACGDNWCFSDGEAGRAQLVIADGLGHGPAAAEASRLAVEAFAAHKDRALIPLMEAMHDACRPTRGAAVAVAEIDLARETLRYVGVGNIAASILTGGKSASLVSMNGIVGVRCEKIQEFSYSWPQNSLLVMSSDGLKTQCHLNRYTGLLGRHPSLIAGVLYRDCNRGTDDSTVAVIQTGK